MARHEGAKGAAIIMEQWSEAASQHSPGTAPIIQVEKGTAASNRVSKGKAIIIYVQMQQPPAIT